MDQKEAELWIRIHIRIRIQWGPWIRIRICNPDPDPKGQKWKHLLKCWKFCSDDWTFSCSLDVLDGGLFAIFDQKNKKNISALFLKIFSHQNPRSISGFHWNAGFGFNESRLTTLPKSHDPDSQHYSDQGHNTPLKLIKIGFTIRIKNVW